MRPAALAAGLALLTAAGPAIANTGDLEQLRAQALKLVNQARQEHGLAPLTLGPDLDQAAQAHAADMLQRHYYSHRSPEGKDVADRYAKAGGNLSNLVEENIAKCQGCATTPNAAVVRRLQRGWMHSPGHRANILARGIERFGFGIDTSKGRPLYAVQTFAGPGVPRGLKPGQKAEPLPPDQAAEVEVKLLNEARRKAGVPSLEINDALSTAAKALLPDPTDQSAKLGGGGKLIDALPAGQRDRWKALGAVAGICTGCGPEPTHADLRFFRQEWLDQPSYRQQLLDPKLTRLGFALRADGAGGKSAVAVLGAPR